SALHSFPTRRSSDLPSGVHLPTFLMADSLTWPGQHAGFLGPRHDPWQITRNPNASNFRVDSLRLAPGMAIDRLQDRRSLLDQVRSEEHTSELQSLAY